MEGGSGFGLLDKALFAVGVRNLVCRQNFDSDRPVKMRIDGLVDGAHSTFADFFGDPVMEKSLSNHLICSLDKYLTYNSLRVKKSSGKEAVF